MTNSNRNTRSLLISAVPNYSISLITILLTLILLLNTEIIDASGGRKPRTCKLGSWRCKGHSRYQCAHNKWFKFPCDEGYTCVGTHDCVPIREANRANVTFPGWKPEESSFSYESRDIDWEVDAEVPVQPRFTGTTPKPSKGPFATWSEFQESLKACGYQTIPTKQQYANCASLAHSAGGITSRMEFAMFLAQLFWESAGLQFKEEISCKETKCPGHYKTAADFPGRHYYGRGYIQLTWHYNYLAASKALFGDERLVKYPDLVSQDDKIAWGTAFWYWKANVHNALGVQQGYFGSTTNAINGALECRGDYQFKAKKRFQCYKKIVSVMKLSLTPNEGGCYELEKQEPE